MEQTTFRCENQIMWHTQRYIFYRHIHTVDCECHPCIWCTQSIQIIFIPCRKKAAQGSKMLHKKRHHTMFMNAWQLNPQLVGTRQRWQAFCFCTSYYSSDMLFERQLTKKYPPVAFYHTQKENTTFAWHTSCWAVHEHSNQIGNVLCSRLCETHMHKYVASCAGLLEKMSR